jgi:hypothetical protein
MNNALHDGVILDIQTIENEWILARYVLTEAFFNDDTVDK